MGLLAIFSSLFGTSCSKRTIHVEFINAKDQRPIAVSKLPPEQIPDTFAIATTLDMAGSKWSVERAEPQDKSDILKAGKVRVYLIAVSTMSPNDILFSLPTISDDMAVATGDILPSPRIFAIHEDDWRQVEFIARKYSTDIEAELADIRRIYQEQRAGVGFKKVHIRKRIPNPLSGVKLALRELEAVLSPPGKFEGVGFDRTRGTIPGSFAWSLDENCVIWGITDESGHVTRLCLLGSLGPRATQVSGQFAKLASEHQLALVDWCRLTNITSDMDAFRTYFTGKKTAPPGTD
jgi:hypothetical protein